MPSSVRSLRWLVNATGMLLIVTGVLLLAGNVALAVDARKEGPAISADVDHSGTKGQSTGEPEHGLSQGAIEISRFLGFPITNSMIVSWITAVGLIVFARI